MGQYQVTDWITLEQTTRWGSLAHDYRINNEVLSCQTSGQSVRTTTWTPWRIMMVIMLISRISIAGRGRSFPAPG